MCIADHGHRKLCLLVQALPKLFLLHICKPDLHSGFSSDVSSLSAGCQFMLPLLPSTFCLSLLSFCASASTDTVH